MVIFRTTTEAQLCIPLGPDGRTGAAIQEILQSGGFLSTITKLPSSVSTDTVFALAIGQGEHRVQVQVSSDNTSDPPSPERMQVCIDDKKPYFWLCLVWAEMRGVGEDRLENQLTIKLSLPPLVEGVRRVFHKDKPATGGQPVLGGTPPFPL